MQLSDAYLHARMLVDSTLPEVWKIRFTKSRVEAGSCDYKHRTLYFSTYYASRATEKEFEEVVLHEVAHAMTPGKGHGKEWKDTARKLGCSGDETVESRQKPTNWSTVFLWLVTFSFAGWYISKPLGAVLDVMVIITAVTIVTRALSKPVQFE